MSLADEILAVLSDTDDTPSVSLFVSLLRRVPGLRQWMRTIQLDPLMREKFNAYLDGKITPPLNIRTGRRLLAWLAGTPNAIQDETVRLGNFRSALPTYGGLTRTQIIALIRKHQSGTIDCAAFLVANAWRRDAQSCGKVSPATMEATSRLLATAILDGQPELIHQLARAADFFHGQAPGTVGRTHFGYAKWWKLTVLAYMLHHPKPAYPLKEFQRHLTDLKLRVDPGDLRRFCRLHNIARDQRPGRPRKGVSIQKGQKNRLIQAE